MANSMPNQPSNCVSDLVLDRLLGDEKSFDVGSPIRTHLNTCTRCQARLNELRCFRDEVELPPFPTLAVPIRKQNRTRQRWVGTVSALMAVAASFAFWSLREHDDPRAIERMATETRTKGNNHLGFYVKRGERVLTGAPDDVLYPGDRIEFTYRTLRPGYLGIFSVDGRGKATQYFPTSPLAAPVPEGEQVLSQSTLLDEVLGREQIFSFFCTNAEPLEPIREALELGKGTLPNVHGCTIETLRFEKRAP